MQSACSPGIRSTRRSGVHDDLYASAAFFEDGATQALLISFDLLAMEQELVARLKTAVHDATGIARDQIFFTCTHTHEGPEVRERKFTDGWYGEERPAYLDDYLDFLAERSAARCPSRHGRAQTCDLLVNRTYVDENMNRRFFLSDERYLGVPGNKHLAAIAPEYADKELGILAFCPAGTAAPLDCWSTTPCTR